MNPSNPIFKQIDDRFNELQETGNYKNNTEIIKVMVGEFGLSAQTITSYRWRAKNKKFNQKNSYKPRYYKKS